MNILTVIKARINSLETNYYHSVGPWDTSLTAPGMVRVTAGYEFDNVIGGLTFYVPIADAARLHVGQKLDVDISVAEEE